MNCGGSGIIHGKRGSPFADGGYVIFHQDCPGCISCKPCKVCKGDVGRSYISKAGGKKHHVPCGRCDSTGIEREEIP